jgi:predicted nucleic acid-binding protein
MQHIHARGNALGIQGRDAIHLAVMERSGIESIMSFDAGLDQYPGITRLHK